MCLVCTEDQSVGSTEVDLQLLDAAKAGDLDVVKVRVMVTRLALNFQTIS